MTVYLIINQKINQTVAFLEKDPFYQAYEAIAQKLDTPRIWSRQELFDTFLHEINCWHIGGPVWAYKLDVQEKKDVFTPDQLQTFAGVYALGALDGQEPDPEAAPDKGGPLAEIEMDLRMLTDKARTYLEEWHEAAGMQLKQKDLSEINHYRAKYSLPTFIVRK